MGRKWESCTVAGVGSHTWMGQTQFSTDYPAARCLTADGLDLLDIEGSPHEAAGHIHCLGQEG